jgi:hypothetical protein
MQTQQVEAGTMVSNPAEVVVSSTSGRLATVSAIMEVAGTLGARTLYLVKPAKGGVGEFCVHPVQLDPTGRENHVHVRYLNRIESTVYSRVDVHVFTEVVSPKLALFLSRESAEEYVATLVETTCVPTVE